MRDLRYGGATHAFTLDYGYDTWGNISNITYPCVIGSDRECRPDMLRKPEVSATWDAMGLENAKGSIAGGSSRALVSEVHYDGATGMMTSWQTPTGWPNNHFEVLHEVVPDGTRPRPAEIKLRDKPWNHLVFDFTYTYDLLGNVMSQGSGIGVTSYAYDLLSRLSYVTNPDSSNRTYAYDDFGNLTSITTISAPEGTGGPTANTVQTLPVDPATNRLAGSGGQSYLFDAMGNLLRRWADGKAQWVRRDPGGRIVAAWTEGVPERYHFAYDHNGERVATFREKSLHVLDVTYTHRDEFGNVLSDFQWNPGGGWTRMADRFYLGRDEQVRVDYAGGGNWTFTTTGRDHLGTARAEVYSNNAWRRVDLWPYGEVRAETPHNTTRTLTNGVHLFTGHERDWMGAEDDARKGLDFMHARYSSFNLGRFMSVDPVGGEVGSSQSWNRYAYVRGNPVNAMDPTGLYEINCGDDDGCKANAEAFEKARLANLKRGDDIAKTAEAYGEPGEANGITVEFGEVEPGADANVKAMTEFDSEANRFVMKAKVTIGRGLKGVKLQAIVGHEGQHLVDAGGFIDTIEIGPKGALSYDVSKNLSVAETERNAYRITHEILSRSNTPMRFRAQGNRGIDLGGAIPAREVQRRIDKIIHGPVYKGKLKERQLVGWD